VLYVLQDTDKLSQAGCQSLAAGGQTPPLWPACELSNPAAKARYGFGAKQWLK